MGRKKTRIFNGSCGATTPEGLPLSEADRLENLIK
jgi:hypothetical protein